MRLNKRPQLKIPKMKKPLKEMQMRKRKKEIKSKGAREVKEEIEEIEEVIIEEEVIEVEATGEVTEEDLILPRMKTMRDSLSSSQTVKNKIEVEEEEIGEVIEVKEEATEVIEEIEEEKEVAIEAEVRDHQESTKKRRKLLLQRPKNDRHD